MVMVVIAVRERCFFANKHDARVLVRSGQGPGRAVKRAGQLRRERGFPLSQLAAPASAEVLRAPEPDAVDGDLLGSAAQAAVAHAVGGHHHRESVGVAFAPAGHSYGDKHQI